MLELELHPLMLPGKAERRTATRHECAETTACVIPDAGKRLWARAKNVSKKGVGLVVHHRTCPGTSLLIEVVPAFELRLQVVHCSRCGRGSWLVGCEFEELLRDDEFVTVLRQWR